MTTDPDPSTTLPGTHRRYGCSVEDYRLVLDTAIPELVRSGLAAETRDIAVGAGVSPNHPLLRDTQVLYDEALRYAFRLIWPRPEDLDVENLVPAEAVRTLVRTAYRRHRAHPDAVRLIVTENIAGYGHVGGRHDVLESSPVVLQIDRVLMRGQDYGAFRPGISAEDVYVLITSLCCFPASQGTTFHTHYGTDLDNAQTVDGLEKLACDAVLAFLTTSMPTTQGSSYTHASPTKTTPSSVSASLYTAGDGGGVEGVVTFQAGDGHDTEELMRMAQAGYDHENDEVVGYGSHGGHSEHTAHAASADPDSSGDSGDWSADEESAATGVDEDAAGALDAADHAGGAGVAGGNGSVEDGGTVDGVESTEADGASDTAGDMDTVDVGDASAADATAPATDRNAGESGSDQFDGAHGADRTDGNDGAAGVDTSGEKYTEFEKLVEATEAAAEQSSYQGYQAYNNFWDPDEDSDPDDENTADDHIAGLYDD